MIKSDSFKRCCFVDLIAISYTTLYPPQGTSFIVGAMYLLSTAFFIPPPQYHISAHLSLTFHSND